jgi:4-amino-4-deoxy-L-arabinose transferase-like glycosyltransferase
VEIDYVRARRWMAAAVFIGLALRLAFSLGYWVDKPMTHDEREYLALAESVAAGRGFVYDSSHESGTAQQFGRAPAYPLFLAIIGAGSTELRASPARVKIAQSVVGAIGIWIIGIIALRAAGPRSAVVAAAVAALYPPLVWMPAYVLSEALYSTLALGAVLALDVAVDHADEMGTGRAGGALALIAGLLSGIAILTRPAMILFLPLAAIWLVRRRRGVLAVALIAAAAAVVAPWTARNVRAYGKFVLIASEGGVTFWTGNHPLARGEGDLAANPDIKRAEIAFRASHPGLTAEQLEPLYYRDAVGHILDRPGRWLGLLVKKAFYTVVPIGPSYTLHSTRYLAASLASYLLLLPLAVVGARILMRARRRPTALLLLATSSVLVCLIFFPQERFRIPVIDPTLIVCASALASRSPAS